VNGNPLGATPVQFSTTAGSLSSPIVSTDNNGIATTVLITSQQATVTASVGAQAPPATGGGSSSSSSSGTPPPTTPTSSGTASGTVTVVVTNAPSLVITPPTSPPSVGLPAAFTFAVTAATSNGSAVRDLTVDWGDGQTQTLGAVTGNAVVSHIYNRTGTFTVTGTVTDASGNRQSVSTAVSVISPPTPTVIVTPSPQSAPGGSTITFTIDIRAPSGITIQNVIIEWGDGQTQTLGGASGTITVTHPYPAGVRTYPVIVTVIDSTGTRTSGSTIVSITT